jgi:hypothetical protein
MSRKHEEPVEARVVLHATGAQCARETPCGEGQPGDQRRGAHPEGMPGKQRVERRDCHERQRRDEAGDILS